MWGNKKTCAYFSAPFSSFVPLPCTSWACSTAPWGYSKKREKEREKEHARQRARKSASERERASERKSERDSWVKDERERYSFRPFPHKNCSIFLCIILMFSHTRPRIERIPCLINLFSSWVHWNLYGKMINSGKPPLQITLFSAHHLFFLRIIFSLFVCLFVMINPE